MKKQYHSKKSKTTNKKVKFKFDPKDDTIQKQNIMFEGKPMDIKTIFTPRKPDITIQERK